MLVQPRSAVLLAVALQRVAARRALALLIRRKPLRSWLALAALAAAAYQAAFFSGVHRTGVLLGTVIAIGTAPTPGPPSWPSIGCSRRST